MKILKKLIAWYKNNQEKNSGRYLEREELKEELKEISKDVSVILESSPGKIPNYALERATFIQNIFLQRKLTQATDGLKIATWILALATMIFAWVAIKDSEHSNEIIQGLQGIVTFVAYFFLIIIALTVLWNILTSIWKFLMRIKRLI